MIPFKILKESIEKSNIQSPKTNKNYKNRNGEKAFILTVQNKSPKVIDMIINNGKFDPKESCLHYSLYISDIEIISIKNFDVNYNFDSYETSLKKAFELRGIEKSEMIFHHPAFNINMLSVYNIL